MNTSGPSSRPRKPYPLALLNHLTVPLKRSTCAPLSCGFPRKGAISGPAQKCVGIVVLTGGAVKAQRHTSVFVGKGRSCRAQAERSSASHQRAVLAPHSAVPLVPRK